MPSASAVQTVSHIAARHIAGFPRIGPGLCAIHGSEPTSPRATELNYQGAYAVNQRQKSWSGLCVNLAEMRCDGHLHVDLGGDAMKLSAVLEEVGGPFEVHTGNRRTQDAPNESAQSLSIIPAGVEAQGRAHNMRFMRHLLLRFDVAFLIRMAEDEIDLPDAFPRCLTFSDPNIMRLVQLFAEECTSDEPHSRLYGDNLSIALLLALSRSSSAKLPPARNGRLAPWQLRRVTEYLAAHLAEDVDLQTVCGLVDLSRSYFSRAFKISTGLAPHQWLLQARIARAKELLLTSDRPLARIAIDVGFADQAHFTRTFGRAVGESPGAWQRMRCA